MSFGRVIRISALFLCSFKASHHLRNPLGKGNRVMRLPAPRQPIVGHAQQASSLHRGPASRPRVAPEGRGWLPIYRKPIVIVIVIVYCYLQEMVRLEVLMKLYHAR